MTDQEHDPPSEHSRVLSRVVKSICVFLSRAAGTSPIRRLLTDVKERTVHGVSTGCAREHRMELGMGKEEPEAGNSVLSTLPDRQIHNALSLSEPPSFSKL